MKALLFIIIGMLTFLGGIVAVFGGHGPDGEQIAAGTVCISGAVLLAAGGIIDAINLHKAQA